MAFNDYANLFSGTGGLLNTLSSASNIIRFTTSAAESAAWAVYKNNYNLINTKDRTVPGALNMLLGSNVASDLMAGGYQPHIGAYLAHKVGVATFTILNKIKNIISPDKFNTLMDRSSELLLQQFDSGISDPLITSILSSFNTVESKTPQKFYEVFYKDFKSAYLTSDRFLCILEKEDETEGFNPSYSNEFSATNRHYQAFLVKNITIPSVDVENVDFMRLGQKFSQMGFVGTNESVMVNYYVDRYNSLYNKLYTHISSDNFKSPDQYYNMYIIINNPYQTMGKADASDSTLAFTNPTAIKMNSAGNFPVIDKEDVISVWKYKNVHVKNINQVTFDNASGEFINLPVVFNHSGMEVTHYDGLGKEFTKYDLNSFEINKRVVINN